MKVDKKEEIPRNRVLYDHDTLERLNEEYGPATEIKRYVKTSAMIYEIRTALRFWFGGKNTYRTNDHTWNKCKMVADGHLVLVNDELVYGDDIEL